MSMEKVLKGLEAYKVIRKIDARKDGESLEYGGTFKGYWINSYHVEILNYYSSVIRDVYNNFSFVNNTRELAHVVCKLTESCALTLARKFNVKTMRLVYRKWGDDLGCYIKLKDGEKRISTFNSDYLHSISASTLTILNNKTLSYETVTKINPSLIPNGGKGPENSGTENVSTTNNTSSCPLPLAPCPVGDGDRGWDEKKILEDTC